MTIRKATCPALGTPGTPPRPAPSRVPPMAPQTRATIPTTPPPRTPTSRLGTTPPPACCLRLVCAVGALFLLPNKPFLGPLRAILKLTVEKRRTSGMIPPLSRRMEQRKVDGMIRRSTSRHLRGDGFDNSTRMALFSTLFISRLRGFWTVIHGRRALDPARETYHFGRSPSYFRRYWGFTCFLSLQQSRHGVSLPFSLIDLVPGSSMDSTGQRPLVLCFLISSRNSRDLALETRLDEFAPRGI